MELYEMSNDEIIKLTIEGASDILLPEGKGREF